MARLLKKALFSLAAVLIIMGGLLFACAGTVHFWQAWVFLAVYGLCGLAIVALLWKNDKALLERRMRGGPTAEKDPVQKVIMAVSTLGFIALVVIPALDRRWGWTHPPREFVFLGDVLIVIGNAAVYRVLRENSFAAATIQVSQEQKVISTGPYAHVRHPMYSMMLIFLVGLPVALGSYAGLAGLALIAPALVWRLVEEEKYLDKNLPGYPDYKSKVRWRLIPGFF